MLVRAAKWLAGRVMRLVPERLLGRLLPGEFAFDPAQTPAPPTPPDAAVRLFIAPVNYAGQGWQWARAVERHVPDAGAVNMVVRMGADFRHPADNVVPLGFYAASKRWQRAQRDAVTAGFTHVLVEAEKQPFGAVLDETVLVQVGRLLDRGVKVAMLCHGSDIRLPSRHIARYPDSPFLDSMREVAPTLEGIARQNRALLESLGVPVFVSTPDLLADVPAGATWLPVVIDPSVWETEAPVLERRVPVVAHAPSSGAVKGSELIDPIVRSLAAEGLLEYRRLERVPFEQMPQAYRDADIVLDQFRLGDYGVAACEAMAAGRIVIANVGDGVRQLAREASGVDLPIVQAKASELDAVLRHLINHRDEARATAAQGPDFVRSLHDGRRSARVLEEFLS